MEEIRLQIEEARKSLEEKEDSETDVKILVLPELSVVPPNGEKLTRVATPEGLILLKAPEDFIKEEDDNSTASDVTDPFEDLHHHCFLKKVPGRKRRYTKREADNLLMNSFTDDYKTALMSVKAETGVPKYLTITDIKKEVEEALSTPAEGQPMSEELVAKFKAIPAIKKAAKVELAELSEEEDSTTTIFDGMSPIWKMLATGQEKFFATPPGYNAFQRETPHWLCREVIPWEELNEAKTKCEEWLQKHSEKELLPPVRRKTVDKSGKKLPVKK